MSAYLIPSSGGEARPLKKSRMYLGRKAGAKRGEALNRKTAFCQLELINGWWFIEDLGCPNGLLVNHEPIKREMLLPDDEIALGKHRFRISYKAPKEDAKRSARKTPQKSTPQKRDQRGGERMFQRKPVEEGVLGRLVPSGGGPDLALTKSYMVVGRSPDCDIALPYRKISAQHCLFKFQDGYWYIRDLDSSNGIKVNGVDCEESWVHPHDQISIASYKYRIEFIPSGEAPERSVAMVEENTDRGLLSKIGLKVMDLDEVVEEEDSEKKPKRWDL